MSVRSAVCLLSIMVLVVATASAAPAPLPANQTVRISAETGENYIQWAWKYDNGSIVTTPLTIYLDDSSTPVMTNYTRSSYLVLSLKANERHNIALYSGNTMVGRASTTTTTSSYVVYYLLAVCFIIMIIAFAITDMIKFVLVSVFNIILTLVCAALASGHGILPYIFFGITVLTGVILLIQGINKLRDEVDWL